MKKLFDLTLMAAICVIAIVADAAADIPFPEALEEANVSLSSIDDGQHESLMLGNGDLYGIVWEKDGGLFMRITKNDIWDARVDTSGDGELPKVDVVTGKISGSTGAPPSYSKVYPQPRCAAALRIGSSKPLRAELDIGKAFSSIQCAGEEEVRVRILKDRNVVLIESPYSVTIEEIKAATLPDARLGKTGGVSWLLMKMPGDVDYKGMEYAVAVAGKGELTAVSLVTSFDIGSGDVLEHAIALAGKTIKEQTSRLVAEHERGWEEYWSRSGIELADKELQRWWYRMLYYAGAVSKPGTSPVALMPPLATDATPWHADYHHNYNSWQMFWPLPGANQSELADPWISYVNDMLPRFEYLAKVTYDCEGVFFPISSFLHEPDPAMSKSKNKRQMSMNPWGLTIGLVGMTVQSMWQKHLCEPDREYLRAKIYPAIAAGARFYVSYMEKCKKDDKGRILLGPSYSPEHGAIGIYNCPFDIAYVHYTFDALIQAANELKVDRELVGQCRRFKALLANYPTAMDKDGRPVVVDWTGCKYKEVGVHNITVPASPVFPGDQVTWFSPEPVKELFRRTIKDTRFNGNNSHVMFNIAKARLSMPEAVGDAKKWFMSRELPNGFFVWQGHQHGTFMPEMVGVAGLINEYMLQSVGNKIRVFPCWPSERDARFSGLRAQGGFLVSAEQKDGKVVSLVIESTVGGRLSLLSPWSTIKMKRRSSVEALTPDSRGIVQVDTRANDKMVFLAE